MTRRIGVAVGSWPDRMPPPDFYVDFAQQVERWGADLLFATDHLYVHNQIPDALCLLSAYAAATERLLIGTSVLLPALREPAWTAKQLATVDYLSGGRLVVGVGVGGEFSAEWEAMGVDRSSRGRRTDEYLAFFRDSWRGRDVDFRGEFRNVTGVRPSPDPVQRGGPPFWIGGRSDAALRRAAVHQGWCAYLESPESIRRKRERLTELRGGDLGEFRIAYCVFAYAADDREAARSQVVQSLNQRYSQDFDRFVDQYCAVGEDDEVASRLNDYFEAGVDDVIFMPQSPRDEYTEQVGRLIAIARRQVKESEQ